MDITGKQTFENGWTVSVIPQQAYRWTVEGLYEVWAWHADGRTDEDVQSHLTPEEVKLAVAEVATRA